MTAGELEVDALERLGKVFRLIPLEVGNGYENMAVDEAILRARIEGRVPSTIRFYRWNPSTVSIGKHQSLSAEVDLDRARELGVGVVRRISGGGAVFHSREDEVTYSVVIKESEVRELAPGTPMAGVSHLLARGLALGVEKYGARPQEGVVHCPAIFIDGKKISGNAQARRRGTILQHGTLLLGVDPELMYSVLRAPVGVPRTRMVQSVRAKVTGLREYLPDIDEADIVPSLVEGFSEALGVEFEQGTLTEYERELAAELVEEKYSTEEWLKKYE
ncbi:MAG: lipoate--protein ligase family protein [Promethearchaeota archaeon]